MRLKFAHLVRKEPTWRLIVREWSLHHLDILAVGVQDCSHHNHGNNDHQFHAAKDIFDLAVYSNGEQIDEKNDQESHPYPDC